MSTPPYTLLHVAEGGSEAQTEGGRDGWTEGGVSEAQMDGGRE